MIKIKQQDFWSNIDLSPIFTLTSTCHNEEMIVLEGNSDNILESGPGRSPDSHLPSECGTVVIHANQHFNFLKDVNLNDQIVIDDHIGVEYQYCVLDVSIIDLEKTQVEVTDTDELKLITPWPFDGFTKDNTLRYVVTARKYETYQN